MAGNGPPRCSKPILHQYSISGVIWEQFWENRIFAFFDHLDLWVLHTFWVKTEKTVYKPVFTVYNRFLVGLNFQKPFRAVLNGVSEKNFERFFKKSVFPKTPLGRILVKIRTCSQKMQKRARFSKSARSQLSENIYTCLGVRSTQKKLSPYLYRHHAC